MGFPLVTKSVTLNDIMGVFCVIEFGSFGTICVKIVDVTPSVVSAKMSP